MGIFIHNINKHITAADKDEEVAEEVAKEVAKEKYARAVERIKAWQTYR